MLIPGRTGGITHARSGFAPRLTPAPAGPSASRIASRIVLIDGRSPMPSPTWRQCTTRYSPNQQHRRRGDVVVQQVEHAEALSHYVIRVGQDRVFGSHILGHIRGPPRLRRC